MQVVQSIPGRHSIVHWYCSGEFVHQAKVDKSVTVVSGWVLDKPNDLARGLAPVAAWLHFSSGTGTQPPAFFYERQKPADWIAISGGASGVWGHVELKFSGGGLARPGNFLAAGAAQIKGFAKIKAGQRKFLAGCQFFHALRPCLYGNQAAGTVAHETPLWEAWFQKRFPMPTEPGNSE